MKRKYTKNPNEPRWKDGRDKLYRNGYSIALYDEDDYIAFVGDTAWEVCGWLGYKPKDPGNTIGYHFRHGGDIVNPKTKKRYRVEFIPSE